jgi:hypothetical protein
MPAASFSNTMTFTARMQSVQTPSNKITFTSTFSVNKPFALFSNKITLSSRIRGDSGDLLAGRYRE